MRGESRLTSREAALVIGGNWESHDLILELRARDMPVILVDADPYASMRVLCQHIITLDALAHPERVGEEIRELGLNYDLTVFSSNDFGLRAVGALRRVGIMSPFAESFLDYCHGKSLTNFALGKLGIPAPKRFSVSEIGVSQVVVAKLDGTFGGQGTFITEGRKACNELKRSYGSSVHFEEFLEGSRSYRALGVVRGQRFRFLALLEILNDEMFGVSNSIIIRPEAQIGRLRKDAERYLRKIVEAHPDFWGPISVDIMVADGGESVVLEASPSMPDGVARGALSLIVDNSSASLLGLEAPFSGNTGNHFVFSFRTMVPNLGLIEEGAKVSRVAVQGTTPSFYRLEDFRDVVLRTHTPFEQAEPKGKEFIISGSAQDLGDMTDLVRNVCDMLGVDPFAYSRIDT